jgi:hypothetical protein
MKPEEQIKKFKRKYGALVDKATKEVAKIAAEKTLKDIKERTKKGIGTDGELKSLSKDYIEFRKRWKAFLAEDTSPDKSNLTATGQLLDALYYRVVGARFFIKVNSKNRSEGLGGEQLEEVVKTSKKGKVTKTYQSRLTNDQIREYTEKAGREFLALSEKEKDDLRKFVKDELKMMLRDILE